MSWSQDERPWLHRPRPIQYQNLPLQRPLCPGSPRIQNQTVHLPHTHLLLHHHRGYARVRPIHPHRVTRILLHLHRRDLLVPLESKRCHIHRSKVWIIRLSFKLDIYLPYIHSKGKCLPLLCLRLGIPDIYFLCIPAIVCIYIPCFCNRIKFRKFVPRVKFQCQRTD